MAGGFGHVAVVFVEKTTAIVQRSYEMLNLFAGDLVG